MIRVWHRMALVTAIAVILADQYSKYWVFHFVEMGADDRRAILPFFSLVHWWNKGISFGMFNGRQTATSQLGILVLLTLAIVSLLMYSLTRSTRKLAIFAFAIIIGGALGNLVDRFHYGAVADFLYFHWGTHGFPAFNLADSCVCVGVGLLLLDGFLSQKRDKSAPFIDE